MPTSCVAPGCTQRHIKGSVIRFFRFPTDEERKMKWCIAMKRMQVENPNKLWEPSYHERLCSLHFVFGQPSTDANHPDYIPSVFNFTPLAKQTPRSLERFDRVAHRRRRLALTPCQPKENAMDIDNAGIAAYALLDLAHQAPAYQDKGTDPDQDPLQVKFDQLQCDYTGLQQEYQRLLEENRLLKSQIQVDKFTYSNIKNSTVRTLTGLPSMEMFTWIMSLVCLYLKPIGKICTGDILLLVLMKLKLGCTNNDLALRFKIAPTQVSAILNNAIPIIAEKLAFLIYWPSKEEMKKNLPKGFRKRFRRSRVIIDCSEVFIQRPSNLNARAKTWSNYKHHNTVKFLIGITPCGTVSFVSSGWGGRVSDKELTERSGFYNMLEPGDLVLADRGFLIEEELAAHGASLAIPPFVKGRQQFSQKEVEEARRLSQLRIHVERAIERVKRYSILKNVLPLTLSRHVDSILIICCAITNVLPKLLK